jgi:hypothetical protein
MTKFIPNQGDIITVHEHEDAMKFNREFITMSPAGDYLCWNPTHTQADTWHYAEPIDEFKLLKECINLNAIIEVLGTDGEWFQTLNSMLCFDLPRDNYRIKDNISPEQFLKHHKDIVAFWDGSEIELLHADGRFTTKKNPTWRIDATYRIKPEPTYYYQYETIVANGVIKQTTLYMTDEYAERLDYTETNGWFKIESSKREWKH